MRAGPEAVAHYGVLTDTDQAAGLADADSFGDVLQDFDDLGFGQPGVEQRRALAFGEAVLAGAAVEEPRWWGLAVAGADGPMAEAPLAVVGAIRVLAAEAGQILPGGASLMLS